jgi:hypothetical protein
LCRNEQAGREGGIAQQLRQVLGHIKVELESAFTEIVTSRVCTQNVIVQKFEFSKNFRVCALARTKYKYKFSPSRNLSKFNLIS